MRVIVPSATPTAATLTRSSTATYINEDGVLMTAAVDQPRYQDGRLLLEAAATNLLQQSQTLDNVYWSKTRATITANATAAPDGTVTAEKIVEDTATGAHHVSRTSVSFTSGQTYTLSAFVKAAERTKGIIQLGNGVVPFSGGIASCTYDLAAGTASRGANGISHGIQALANGWFRVWITGAAQATASDNAFATLLISGSTSSYTGDGVSGLYVWGVQLEVGTEPSSYYATTGSTATRSADSFSGEYMISFAGTAVGLPIQLLDEDDTSAWVSGATYAVGDLVHLVSTHRVYRRLVAGAGTTSPSADPTNWLDLRSTSRWAPLTLDEDTRAIVIGNLYFTLLTTEAGAGLFLGGIRAESVRVVVQSPPYSSIAFDQTYTMPAVSTQGIASSSSVGNEPVLAVSLPADMPANSLVHVSLIGMPEAPGSALTTAWLRYLALGQSYTLGGTLQGSRIGIADYSRKETDEFGTTTLVQRSYAKRLNLEMTLPNSQVQATFAVLADLRATPAMWVPAEGSALSWLATYGWLKDWGITVAYTNSSLCTLEIEGLI